MADIYIAIGSNEQPLHNIGKALSMLADHCKLIRESPWYASPAVGSAEGQFVNLVIGAETELVPAELIVALKSIERMCGGLPTNQILDLDLLLYDDLVLNEGAIRVPRDDIEKFAFVLKPLAELAPELHHPVLGKTYAEMWLTSDLDAASLKLVSPNALE